MVEPIPTLFLKYAEIAALPATSSWASEVVALAPRRIWSVVVASLMPEVLKRVQRPEPAPVSACEIVSVPPRATEPPPVRPLMVLTVIEEFASALLPMEEEAVVEPLASAKTKPVWRPEMMRLVVEAMPNVCVPPRCWKWWC